MKNLWALPFIAFALISSPLLAQELPSSTQEIDQAISQLSDQQVVELYIAVIMAQETPPQPPASAPDLELIKQKLKEILDKLKGVGNLKKKPIWDQGIAPWLEDLGLKDVPGGFTLASFCSKADLQKLLEELAKKLGSDPKKILEQLKKLIEKLKAVPAVDDLGILPIITDLEKELNKFPADFNDQEQAKKLKDDFLEFFKKLLEDIKGWKPGTLTTPIASTASAAGGDEGQGGMQIDQMGGPPSVCFVIADGDQGLSAAGQRP